MHEDTLKWLLGALVTLATVLTGVIWWAAQSDASIKTNASNILRLEARGDEVIKRLEELRERLLKLEWDNENRENNLDARLDSIDRKLDGKMPKDVDRNK